MYRRTRWGFATLALFMAGCVWLLSEVRFPLGIDLRGGTELVYFLDLSHVPRETKTVAEEVKDIIARRLNARGLKELSISIVGEDRMVVQLPGGDEATVQELIEQVEKSGNLTFRLVASGEERQRRIDQYIAREARYNAELEDWAERMREWRRRNDSEPDFTEPEPPKPEPPPFIVRIREIRDPDDPTIVTDTEQVVLENRPGSYVDGRYLSDVYSGLDENLKPAVYFSMSGEGAALLGDLTGNNIGRNMAIVLDDVIQSAPVIRARITTSGIIEGQFTSEEVRSLVTILRGGSLPTKPQLISQNTVGPLLGKESVQSGIRAVLFGLAIVMVFIALYYLAAGLVTDFALVFNVLVVLAYVATFRQDLTLPGIAGILLTIGMAVDANILIFERVREERRRGKGLRQALSTGYQRAFSVIFDSNLTTVITGIVLFNVGTGPVKGFAVTLIAGILVSFVSALFVTRLFLSFLLNADWVRKLKMVQAFDTPRVPFVSFQRPFLVGSLFVIALTWSLVVYRGWENYGIDFTGGARIRMTLTEDLTRDQLEEKIQALAAEKPELFRNWSLQTLDADTTGRSRQFALLTRAGVTEMGIAEALPAQEAPESPEAEGAPPPAEAPPGADTPAPPGESAAPPPPSAGKAPPAAERVREALEGLLREEGLLLPEGFPDDPVWTPEENSSRQAMTVDVHLVAVDPTMTTEWLSSELTKHLAKNPRFEGISCAGAEVVQRPTDRLPAARYRVRLTPYEVPLPGQIARTPTKSQAFAELRSFFGNPPPVDGRKPFELSVPFPQVATVGPRVATDLQGKAVVAIFISMLGIIFYISLRFEFIFGVAAIAALVHDIMVTIGVMAVTDHFLGNVVSIKINLPELAALLTIIGYSINDTIVVFDRIRENLKFYAKKKLSFRDCVDMSINQTLGRTVWTSLTTLITVLALLILGGEAVQGFAYTFAIGLVAGTYSSVFVASPILIMLHERAERRREALQAA